MGPVAHRGSRGQRVGIKHSKRDADSAVMEILLADVFLLAGTAGAVRWGRHRPARFVPLVAAVAAAACFTLVRNAKNLEESAFMIALGLACAVSWAVTVVVTLAARAGTRSSFAYGALAAVLVPPLFAAVIVAHYTYALISGANLE